MSAPAHPPSPAKSTPVSVIILLTLSGCLASTFIFSVMALDGFAPMAVGAARMVIGGIFLAILTFVLGHGLVRSRREWGFVAVYGLGCLLTPFLITPWVAQYLSTTTIALYYAVIPLEVLVLSRLFLKTEISLRKWMGFCVGTMGVVVLAVSGGDAGMVPMGPPLEWPFLPHLGAIIAALFLASGAVLIQAMPRMSPMAMTSSALLCGSAVALPLLVFSAPSTMPSQMAIMGALGTGVIATGLGLLLRTILIKRENAVFTATNGYIVPLFVGAMGVAFLGETIVASDVLAYLIIVSGLIIAR